MTIHAIFCDSACLELTSVDYEVNNIEEAIEQVKDDVKGYDFSDLTSVELYDEDSNCTTLNYPADFVDADGFEDY